MFAVQFAKANRREQLISKLIEQRRKEVDGVDYSQLVSTGTSPLYYDELKSIILGYWDKFQNSVEMEKVDFEYHMNVVNKARYDAHAKDVDDHAFDKVRMSLAELESKFGPEK